MSGSVSLTEFQAWGDLAGIQLTEEEKKISEDLFHGWAGDDKELDWREAEAALMVLMGDEVARNHVMDAAAYWWEQNDGSPSGKLN